MIGAVIGWKFNHQDGMNTVDGVITEFPGGIPSQADQDVWTVQYGVWKLAIDTIATLETEITNRRLRECAMGIDDGWMVAQEALIAEQRELL
jgi:formylmethanofuran:tetrahydromethanopterin formyltransferase